MRPEHFVYYSGLIQDLRDQGGWTIDYPTNFAPSGTYGTLLEILVVNPTAESLYQTVLNYHEWLSLPGFALAAGEDKVGLAYFGNDLDLVRNVGGSNLIFNTTTKEVV